MVQNYNSYYIMDAPTEADVHEVITLAVEMAKESYPHLVASIRGIEDRYIRNLETFCGSENKPATSKAYNNPKTTRQ